MLLPSTTGHRWSYPSLFSFIKRDNRRNLSPQVQRVQFDPMLHDLAANQAKGITSCGSKLLLDTGETQVLTFLSTAQAPARHHDILFHVPIMNGLLALREGTKRERQEVFEVLAIAGTFCTFGFEPLKSGSRHLVQDGQAPPVDHFIVEAADDRLVVFH